jgi:hypothetical protein
MSFYIEEQQELLRDKKNLSFFIVFSAIYKMSQENAEKCQKPLGEDNANYINTLTTELDMVKEKNKALEEMLGEAEQKAQTAKSEVRNTSRPKWEINKERLKNKNLKKTYSLSQSLDQRLN